MVHKFITDTSNFDVRTSTKENSMQHSTSNVNVLSISKQIQFLLRNQRWHTSPGSDRSSPYHYIRSLLRFILISSSYLKLCAGPSGRAV